LFSEYRRPNILLRISRGQIEPGIEQRRVQGDRLLKVVDRLFELGVLVSLHTFVEVVARLQFGASGAREHHQRGGEYHQEFLRSFHCFMNLLAAE